MPERVDLEGPQAPNVVLLIGDDHGWADLGCAELTHDVATPALDALASQGVRFTQAYASSPICSPSRAGLMTGCYQARFGSYWYGGKGMHDAGFLTIAELFSAAGYATGYVGKFHYGGGKAHVPGNRNFPLEHGFESFFGFSGGRKHYLVHNDAAEERFQTVKREHERQGQSLRQGAMWDGDEKVDGDGFTTELFGKRARAFLDEHQEEPFLLTVAFNAVHNFTHQLPSEYLEEHALEGWRDWDPAIEEYYDWYQAGRFPNNPEGRAHYLGQLHYLDREIGRLVAHLEELGLRENTIVVYVGDNGGSTPIYANNGPLRGGKYTLYEGGLRVPLIVSWPERFEANVVRHNVVSALDLLPTLCAAAEIAFPSGLDGQDIRGLLTGTDLALGHETLVWDTGHERAVRHGPWKLHVAENRKHADYEMTELELGTFLTDLRQDLGERTNLAAQYPEIVEELERVYADWKAGLESSAK